jgi:hypothetical protein
VTTTTTTRTEGASEHAYIGRAPCGHVRAAVVDDPEQRAWTASHVADMVTSGLVVERVTIDHAQANGFGRCDRCDPPKPKQAALFDLE